MKNKLIVLCGFLLIIGFLFLIFYKQKEEKNNDEVKELSAVVISNTEDTITVQDVNNVIYTFEFANANTTVGNKVLIEYTGLLDKNAKIQEVSVLKVENTDTDSNKDTIPAEWNDNGIFKQNYQLAYNKLKTMTLDEKIGQLLLVRYTDKALKDINKYNYGGFVFYKVDFDNKDEEQVKAMINNAQKSSKIPLLTAVDEEGGKVIRISSNPKLAESEFKAPSELFNTGGLDLIKEDTLAKSRLLNNLGINLNLAPVVDVATDPDDYIYDRSLKQDVTITSLYSKTVIETSKKGNVSFTLKHFPGYGNNSDTHLGTSVDDKTLDDIKKYDLPPFESGINAGAEAVLISHNIVNALDSNNPASLSVSSHNLLRNELGFTGIIITDDISMGALDSISQKTVKSLLAGNDLIITTDYEESFNEIKNAVNSGAISEELVNKLAFRVLSWKYYKNLITDSK